MAANNRAVCRTYAGDLKAAVQVRSRSATAAARSVLPGVLGEGSLWGIMALWGLQGLIARA